MWFYIGILAIFIISKNVQFVHNCKKLNRKRKFLWIRIRCQMRIRFISDRNKKNPLSVSMHSTFLQFSLTSEMICYHSTIFGYLWVIQYVTFLDSCSIVHICFFSRRRNVITKLFNYSFHPHSRKLTSSREKNLWFVSSVE